MSSKLINSLLKRHNPEKEAIVKQIVDRDKDVAALKSLYQTPLKEKGNQCPHYQVFEDGYQQADLLFLPQDNKYNYCLVVVDIHSRKCDAQQITTKSSDTVVKAFEKIYDRGILELPIRITFDNGSEFKGQTKQYFKDLDIKCEYAETNRHRQVAMVEAKNKTIGSTLHKLMALIELKTGKENRQWVKYLPDLIHSINESIGPTIDTQLSDEPFSDKANENVLSIGTRVRTKLDYPISVADNKKLHGIFRSSDIRWSRDIKKITNIILKPGFPILYTVGEEPFNRTRQEVQVIEPIEYV